LSITQVVNGSTAIHLSSVDYCGFTIEHSLRWSSMPAACGLIDV
jgi:hypothetical protein